MQIEVDKDDKWSFLTSQGILDFYFNISLGFLAILEFKWFFAGRSGRRGRNNATTKASANIQSLAPAKRYI